MGNHPSDPGPQRQICCSVHPSEPIVGMCGCGTLFCRQCSPSSVFCASCHEKHESVARSRGESLGLEREQRAAVMAPRWPALHAGMPGRLHGHHYGATAVHPQARPLSHRVMLEALLLTILTVAVFGMIFQMQDRAFSFSSSGDISSFGIDARTEPVQKATSPFNTSLAVSDGEADIFSQNSYSISAKVESVKPYGDAVGELIPYDLLLAWGDMAKGDVDGRLNWEQSDRQGSVSGTLGGSDGADVSTSYVINHVSNNHLIPANSRIMAALETIRPGDLVKIDGRLVDVKLYTDDNRVLSVSSSLTRSDQGDGACEVIYVEYLKINEKSYH